MKTISTLLLVTALAAGLRAQPAPPAQPPASPAPAAGPTNQDDPVRAALDRAYGQFGGIGAAPSLTPAPTRATNRNIAPLAADPPAAAPAAPPVVAPVLAPAAVTAAPAPPGAPTITPSPINPNITVAPKPTNAISPSPATPAANPANPVLAPAAATIGNATPVTAAAAPTNAPARVRRPPPAPPAFNIVDPAAQPAAAGQAPVAGAIGNAQPAAGIPPAIGGANPAAAAAAGKGTNAITAGSDDEVFGPGFLKFDDADLSQVLIIYQELTGRTVLKPNTLPQAKVNIRSQTPLTRREAIQALDSILSLNGITMIPQGDKFVKAMPEGQAGTAGAQFNDLPTELLPESGVFTIMIYQLKNAIPTDVVPAIQPFAKLPNSIIAIPASGILVLRDYAENVKRMTELLDKIDVVPISDIKSVVIPIKYALVEDIASVLSSLSGGGGGGGVSAGSTRAQGRGLSGSGLGGAGGGLGGAGGFGAGGFGAGGIGQPGYGANTGLGGLGGAGGLGGGRGSQNSFQQRLQNIVNRASSPGGGGDIVLLRDTRIIPDPRTNNLLIFATDQDIEMIKDIISKLDIVLAQVLIEALIMEVSLDNKLNYGISYLQKNPSQKGNFTGIGAIRNRPAFGDPGNFANNGTNSGANSLGSGLTYFARFGGDLDVSFEAAASDSNSRILSRPRIQTSHAVQADLFIGRTRPYITGSYSYFGGGPQTQFQQQQIGITLQILPLINQEGLVVMDIHQKIQDVGNEIPVGDNLTVPETIDREANAKVAVHDRETIMLGGFISDHRSKSKSGVPILKDIPVLGNLFSSKSDNYDRAELIVLIRPTVLPTPQDASMFAAEARAQLPATRAAEQDFMERERKQQKKANQDFYKKEGFSK